MNSIKHKTIAYAGTVLFALGLASSSPAACTKIVYVHYVAFGSQNYQTILDNKNGCWGIESPFASAPPVWGICSASSQPSGGTRWAYNEVTNPSTDQAKIQTCKSRNGGAADTVYVTPNSGGYDKWSH